MGIDFPWKRRPKSRPCLLCHAFVTCLMLINIALLFSMNYILICVPHIFSFAFSEPTFRCIQDGCYCDHLGSIWKVAHTRFYCTCLAYVLSLVRSTMYLNRHCNNCNDSIECMLDLSYYRSPTSHGTFFWWAKLHMCCSIFSPTRLILFASNWNKATVLSVSP